MAAATGIKRSHAVAALYEGVLNSSSDGNDGEAVDAAVLRVELAEELCVLERLVRRIRARIQPDWLALPPELLAMIVSQQHCTEATRREARLSCRTLRAAVDLNFSACAVLPFRLTALLYPPTMKLRAPFIPLARHLWNLQTLSVTYRSGARLLSLPELLDGRLPALRNLSLAEFAFPLKYDALPFSSLRPLDELRIQRLPTTDAAQQLAQLVRLSVQRLVYDVSITGAAGSLVNDKPCLKNDLGIFCKTIGRIHRSSPARCVRRVALLLEVGKHKLRGLDVLPESRVIFGVFDELLLLDATCTSVSGLPNNCPACIDLRLYCFSTFAPRIYLANAGSQSNRTSACFPRWAVVLAANPNHSFGHYRVFCVDACVPYVAGLRRKVYPRYAYHNAQADAAAKSIALAVANATTLLGTPPTGKKPVARFAPLVFGHPHDAHPFHFPTALPLLVNDLVNDDDE